MIRKHGDFPQSFHVEIVPVELNCIFFFRFARLNVVVPDLHDCAIKWKCD